jgi:hypothetical protein
MNAIRLALTAILGLVVEDGSLALGILGFVGGVTALRFWAGLAPLATGLLLLAGALALLAENLLRFNRKRHDHA